MRLPFALLLALTLDAGAADFAPGKLKGPKNGPQNEVLVLGTPHLSQLPASFAPGGLGLLNERLAAWRPQAIAIEALSGTQCAFMRQFPHRYQDTIDTYCWDPAPARAATGLDVAAATQQLEAMLGSWPSTPGAAQRRRLAALFLAAGEPASAVVQWLRLPEAERKSGDGLSDELVTALETLRAKRNELYLIAAPLAARLGLERLHPFDDHTADQPMKDEADHKRYGAALMKAWDNPAGAKRKQQDDALYARIGTQEGVLALYRALNAPEQWRLIFDNDFGAALEEPSSQRYGRDYVGYWETRNLRMAANIRELMNARIGSRTLVLVGASHKGYLDAYLDQMHDLRLADAQSVLATSQTATAAPAAPLAIGETWTIGSALLGENRRINVYLPAGAPAATPLPVLYMPDGGTQEDFLHVAGLLQVGAGNATTRPFLLVGIENTERRRDLTGPTANPKDRAIAPRVGGSQAFRDFIRKELMPEVAKRYRTTSERAIVGESLAGLFVVETLVLEPDLFDTYIAIDPSLWWNNGELVKRIGAHPLAAGGGKKLYIAASADAMPSIDRAALASGFGKVVGLGFHYEEWPGESHATIYHPAALKAFRQAFRPSKPAL